MVLAVAGVGLNFIFNFPVDSCIVVSAASVLAVLNIDD